MLAPVMEILPLLLALLLVAGFTQGATGFGFGLVAMSVLPHVLDVREAVPLVSVFGLVLCLAMLWRYRSHVDPRKFLPLLAGEVVGTPLGALYLRSIEPQVVTGTLGAFLLVYGTASLVAERRRRDAAPHPRVGRRWGPLAGLLGGLIGGAFNTGGPPVIVYATARGWDAGAFKANLSVLFLFNTAVQLVLFAWWGLLTPRVLRLDLIGMPALLLGLGAGMWASSFLDAARFRRVVLALLVVLGVVFLVRSF